MTHRPGMEAAEIPPFETLRERLLSLAATLEAGGLSDTAAELRRELDGWWAAQQQWNAKILGALGVHHEINNALVGVRGNAQLAMLGAGAQVPGLRERLEIVVRESERIQQLAARLRQLRSAMGERGDASRAA